MIIRVETKKYKAWENKNPSRQSPKIFHDSKTRFRLVVAGIQSGKTIAGINEAIRYMVKEAPGTTGMAVAPTFPMLEQQLLPEMFRWLPPRKVENQVVWNYLKTERRLELANGSVCFFRHADDPDSLRGPHLSWFYGDEIALWPHDAWLIMEGRTSVGQGRGWGTTTPKGYNWLYSLYQKYLMGDPDYSDYDFFIWHSKDSPYISKEEIERVRKIYSEAYFRQEYEASFESYVGRVYPEFSVETHVVEPFPIGETYETYESIDAGISAPTAVLFAAVDPQGTLYIYDEHYVSGQAVPYHAECIKKKRIKEPALTVIDPHSGSARSMGTGETLVQEYAGQGIFCILGDDNVMLGIDRVKQYLGQRKVLIFKNCVNLIEELLNYQWAAGRVGGDAKEKPRKVRDHCVDALRYLILTRPEPAQIQKEPTLKDKVMAQLQRKREEQALDMELGDTW